MQRKAPPQCLPLGFGNCPRSMPPASCAEKPARCGKEEDSSVRTLLRISSSAADVDGTQGKTRGRHTVCGQRACPATARCPPRAASGSPRRSPRNPHCPCPPPQPGMPCSLEGTHVTRRRIRHGQKKWHPKDKLRCPLAWPCLCASLRDHAPALPLCPCGPVDKWPLLATSFIHSFTHSFGSRLLSTYYIPGFALGTGNPEVNATCILDYVSPSEDWHFNHYLSAVLTCAHLYWVLF